MVGLVVGIPTIPPSPLSALLLLMIRVLRLVVIRQMRDPMSIPVDAVMIGSDSLMEMMRVSILSALVTPLIVPTSIVVDGVAGSTVVLTPLLIIVVFVVPLTISALVLIVPMLAIHWMVSVSAVVGTGLVSAVVVVDCWMVLKSAAPLRFGMRGQLSSGTRVHVLLVGAVVVGMLPVMMSRRTSVLRDTTPLLTLLCSPPSSRLLPDLLPDLFLPNALLLNSANLFELKLLVILFVIIGVGCVVLRVNPTLITSYRETPLFISKIQKVINTGLLLDHLGIRARVMQQHH